MEGEPMNCMNNNRYSRDIGRETSHESGFGVMGMYYVIIIFSKKRGEFNNGK